MKQTQNQYPVVEPHAQIAANDPNLSNTAIVHLRDGEVVLYKRERSARWQARFKLFDRKWRRVTTQHASLEYAVRAACEAYDEARFRERLGLPQATKRFDAVARATVAELRDDLASGTGKSIYTDYVQVIEKYLLPFLGKRWITAIDASALKEFEAWRNKQLGRVPRASTMLTHAAALSRVFDVAVRKGWLSDKHLVPRLNTKGQRSVARPAFEPKEIEALLMFMPSWMGEAHRPAATEMRELLRDYVEVLLYTGMRHGTESFNLRWQHIDIYTDAQTGTTYTRIWVSGKTGPRSLIAKHTATPALNRIRSRFADLAVGTLAQTLERKHNDWVFRLRNGNRTPSLGGTFKQLMRASGLLKSAGGTNRTLYSLRHTYATQALLAEGVDVHTLARQMGTSVVMIERHYSKLTATMAAGRLA